MATPDDVLDQFSKWMIARDLQLRRRADIAALRLPAGEARLYVHADLPADLVCQNAADREARFGSHKGRIVYRIDLSIPPDAVTFAMISLITTISSPGILRSHHDIN